MGIRKDFAASLLSNLIQEFNLPISPFFYIFKQ